MGHPLTKSRMVRATGASPHRVRPLGLRGAGNVEHKVPQPGLHIEHVGLDRVPKRVRELESLAVAASPDVDLECVASPLDMQVRTDRFKSLLEFRSHTLSLSNGSASSQLVAGNRRKLKFSSPTRI
jgi:hypothetical protein